MKSSTKDKLFYLLMLALEYGINPKAFMWKIIMGRHSTAYYSYLKDLRKRRPFDYEKLEEVYGNFEQVLKNARKVWRSKWKGDWYLVIFDIPENHRKYRDKLRRSLVQFGFGQLQESIFISPVDRWRHVEESVYYEEMKPYLIYLSVKKVYGFDLDELIAKCWDLDATRSEYLKFIDDYKDRISRFLASSQNWSEKERRVGGRWFLLMLQEEMAELLRRYPPLPRDFVCHIPFAQLEKSYLSWKKILRRSC